MKPIAAPQASFPPDKKPDARVSGPAVAAPITREIVSESSLKNAPRSGRREQASGEPDAVTGNELLALARYLDRPKGKP